MANDEATLLRVIATAGPTRRWEAMLALGDCAGDEGVRVFRRFVRGDAGERSTDVRIAALGSLLKRVGPDASSQSTGSSTRRTMAGFASTGLAELVVKHRCEVVEPPDRRTMKKWSATPRAWGTDDVTVVSVTRIPDGVVRNYRSALSRTVIASVVAPL